MDKKKLIGTIVGVAMFAALIAGATFAWLTITAPTTNGIYNGSTMNFVVNYTGGTNVTGLNILSSPTPSAITAGKGLIIVSAHRTAASAPGTLNIKFKLESSASSPLITDNAVKYAVCAGAACTSITAQGSIGSGDTTLYSAAIPTTPTSYYIYLWLDGETIEDTHMNQKFAGYVYADATQTD